MDADVLPFPVGAALWAADLEAKELKASESTTSTAPEASKAE